MQNTCIKCLTRTLRSDKVALFDISGKQPLQFLPRHNEFIHDNRTEHTNRATAIEPRVALVRPAEAGNVWRDGSTRCRVQSWLRIHEPTTQRQCNTGEIEDVSPLNLTAATSPDCTARSPGFFVFVIAPLAKLADAPVLETGFSEFDSRVGHQEFCSAFGSNRAGIASGSTRIDL
jgi:hypothetical protein